MIVAVDFDGTLARTDYPTIIEPITEVIRLCKRHRMVGNTLILNTCRHGNNLDDAVAWCKEQGLEFDYVNENPPDRVAEWGDCRKIYADVYIDDHNVSIIDAILLGGLHND